MALASLTQHLRHFAKVLADGFGARTGTPIQVASTQPDLSEFAPEDVTKDAVFRPRSDPFQLGVDNTAAVRVASTPEGELARSTAPGTHTLRFLEQKIDIDQKSGALKLSQTDLIDKIIERFECEFENKVYPTKTPTREPLKNEGDLCVGFPIRGITGSLMHLSASTRPDLSFLTKELSGFMIEPRSSTKEAARRGLGYLRKAREHGLVYRRVPN